MAEESTTYHHRPVMVSEVIETFETVPTGVLVDATVGGGGHAAALLDAVRHIDVIGLDQDAEAMAASARTLERFGSRVTLRQGRFDRLAHIVEELGHKTVVGVLFDLGVSSPQLDQAERGFSYRLDGPLDMRMDASSSASLDESEPRSTSINDAHQALTADDVVNTYERDELARVIAEHGDERFAKRIAAAIVVARPLRTTTELAAVVRDAIPAPARRRGGHPAKRTFQAIRIEVNNELDILADAVDQGIDVLEPGGRIAVLAYHSGEDRIVKRCLRNAESGGCSCPPQLPCRCGAVPLIQLLKRGSRRPSSAEIAANLRAESARLRTAEKLVAAKPASRPQPEGWSA